MKNRGTKITDKNIMTTSFIVIIPVLDESKIILSTIHYFLKLLSQFPGSKLAIVTTNKELIFHEQAKERARDFINQSTAKGSIIKFIKNEYNVEIDSNLPLPEIKNKALFAVSTRKNTIDLLAEIKNDNLLVINYPETTGKMAHQLNFCMQYLINRGTWTKQLLGIYNADSRPEAETFLWINQQAVSGNINVYQQYGNYFNNYSSIAKSNFLKKSILFSSSVWQNRWSIGFEVYYNLKQKLFSRSHGLIRTFFYPLNYCVGHGLFFTRKIYEELGDFPDKTHNEDAIFGLELSFRKEYICPIPYFDYSDSPDSLRSLFFQKATWFFGPFETPVYYRLLKDKFRGAAKTRLFVLSSKLFSHAIFWLLGPTFIIIMLGQALGSGNFAQFLIIYTVFLVLPNLACFLLSRYNKKIKAFPAFIFIIIGSLPAYIMHGLSAYYSIFRFLKHLYTGQSIDKYKTKILRT